MPIANSQQQAMANSHAPHIAQGSTIAKTVGEARGAFAASLTSPCTQQPLMNTSPTMASTSVTPRMHPYAMASGGANGTHMPKMIVNAIDNANHCAGCQSKIADRYLLEAMGKYWHEDCLKCTACSCRLGEVGSTLYFKEEMLLCKRDYLRIFGACARTPVHPAFCGTGQTGNCAACHQKIPAFEMVMRARQLVYHLDCFACQQCESRFCVGDRFYLCDGKILCQYDYDERMMFAQMAVAYQQQQMQQHQIVSR